MEQQREAPLPSGIRLAIHLLYSVAHRNPHVYTQSLPKSFKVQLCKLSMQIYRIEVEIFASMEAKFSHFGQGTFHSTE